MSTPARQSDIVRMHQAALRGVPDVGLWQASPGDQILPEPSRARRRFRKWLTWSTLAALAAAAVWNAPDERYRDPAWLLANGASMASSAVAGLGALTEGWTGAAKTDGATRRPTNGPLAAGDARIEPASAELRADSLAETFAAAPAEPGAGTYAPVAGQPVAGHMAAYVPPQKAPSDPLRDRAALVGLHPDISLAVLARLSPTDFQNAGVAIRTALAETADDAVHLWPRQRTPEQALFQVHFVPGAPSGCRRYVVTITMDRWSATALPMERCGSEPTRSKG